MVNVAMACLQVAGRKRELAGKEKGAFCPVCSRLMLVLHHVTRLCVPLVLEENNSELISEKAVCKLRAGVRSIAISILADRQPVRDTLPGVLQEKD